MRGVFRLLALAFLAPAAWVAEAVPVLQPFFSDNMALQRDIPVPVWGTAKPGESVTVSFAGQQNTATAGKDGRWLLKLDPLAASAAGRELKVGPLVFKGVVVGDVWLCSGQSNMDYPMKGEGGDFDFCSKQIAQSDIPGIRLLLVRQGSMDKAPSTTARLSSGGWMRCNAKTLPNFSAVGFFFGRELHQATGVPIGLVACSVGGTPIEDWTPPESLGADPELKPIYDEVMSWRPETPQGKAALADTVNAVERWTAQARADLAAGKEALAPLPKLPGEGGAFQCATRRYNGMVAPFAPYGIRGVIWYQGEANTWGDFRHLDYLRKLKAMVSGWRQAWGQGDFPFYLVQLANWNCGWDKPSDKGVLWSQLRERQRLALDAIPNTGMAVTIDIGDNDRIHPLNKLDVGKRLALWALAKDYCKNVVCSGPLYKDSKLEGNKIRVSFDYVGSGLMVGKKEGYNPAVEDKGAKLAQFAVKQKGGDWFWAEAAIDGDDVLVWSDKAPEPEAVRYAYQNNPKGCNLYNREGLPASPFTAIQP